MTSLSALDILRHPQNFDDSDINEAIHCAVKALKKQIPKKPIKYIVPAERIKIRNSYWCKGTTIYKCPHCNNYISITNIYCHECGQALDWSDTE